MKTIEQRAQEYCEKNIPNLPDMHFAIATAYEEGATEERRQLTKWHDIAKDKDGFATNKAYSEIASSVPILVKDVVWDEMFVVDKNNIVDWSGSFETHPSQYKWRKIQEL